MSTFSRLLLMAFAGAMIMGLVLPSPGKLPADLKTSTIIFLEYDEIPVSKRDEGGEWMVERRNKFALSANEQLRESVKKYPYKYVIMKRSEYIESSDSMTAEYVLDSPLMEAAANGTNTYAGMNATYVSAVYIIDRRTGIKYNVVSMIKPNQVYMYKKIMEEVIRKVQRID